MNVTNSFQLEQIKHLLNQHTAKSSSLAKGKNKIEKSEVGEASVCCSSGQAWLQEWLR